MMFDFVDYFRQKLGHWQHGIGEFKYQTNAEHEAYREQYEDIDKKGFWCSCSNCAKNRLKRE